MMDRLVPDSDVMGSDVMGGGAVLGVVAGARGLGRGGCQESQSQG
jgi:hypothetical protein